MKKLLALILFCGILSAKDNIKFQQQGNTSNTIAIWHFNEGSGTTAYDNSGENNHGVITEATYTDDNIMGKSLDFDGTNDKVTLPQLFRLIKDFTIVVWFKRASAVNYRAAIGGATKPDSDQEWAIGFDNATTLIITMKQTDGTIKTLCIDNGNDFNDGKWHFLAVTRNTVTQKMSSYLNGHFDNVEEGGNLEIKDWGASRVTNIGLWGQYDASTVYFWDGLIEEFCIYNKALTTAEIAAIYQQQKGRYVK